MAAKSESNIYRTDHSDILGHVFPEAILDDQSTLTFDKISDHIKQCINDNFDEAKLQNYEKGYSHSRLGPTKVSLDTETNIGGHVMIDHSRLLVVGHSSFSTSRANCCVYAGKWSYEVRLVTNGLLQLGWCTLKCSFSRENGVGDTPDSFSYDGSRVRRWNSTFSSYGEAWECDDVITCCIDCDEGTITFYRNGRDLGVAFSDIRLGPGIAYFPAISLANNEAVYLNFGETPLVYPVEGYKPLQPAPLRIEMVSTPLFVYLERLIPMTVDTRKDEGINPSSNNPQQPKSLSRYAICWLIASKIIPFASIALRNEYIVHKFVIPLISKFCDISCFVSNRQEHIGILFQFLYSFLSTQSYEKFLLHLLTGLYSNYHCFYNNQYTHQRTCLTILLCALRHDPSRRFLISFLFDLVQLPVLCHVKSLPGDAVTKDAYIFENVDFSPSSTSPLVSFEMKTEVKSQISSYKARISYIEELVIEVLKTLLIHTDADKRGLSSQSQFAERLRDFLKENFSTEPTASNSIFRDCPQHVLPSFFHYLLKAVHYKWAELSVLDKDMPNFEDFFLPVEYYCLDEVEYFDVPRLGGLMSYLTKTYKDDIAAIQRSEKKKRRSFSFFRRDNKGDKFEVRRFLVNEVFHRQSSSQEVSSSDLSSGGYSFLSLLSLVDSLMILFYLSVYRTSVRNANELIEVYNYTSALQDTRQKLQKCPPDRDDIRATLLQSEKVLTDFLISKENRTLNLLTTQFSHDFRHSVHWIFNVLMNTFHEASLEDNLFRFLPDFLVSATMNCCYALRDNFGIILPFSSLPDYNELLVSFARFLTAYFDDRRILTSETRELFLSNLVFFITEPPFMRALEKLNADEQATLTKSLLCPTTSSEGPASRVSLWFLTNRILVRFWKGNGFAFRYVREPEDDMAASDTSELLHNTKPKTDDPCPSSTYQTTIKTVLKSSSSLHRKVIDFLLSKVNVTFSEYISVSQDYRSSSMDYLQRASASRQAKIMASFLDMTVTLVRTLEMLVFLHPEFFLQTSSQSHCELFLSRLAQVVGQIFLRISPSPKQFPLLAAVCGIVYHLTNQSPKIRRTTLKVLSDEASLSKEIIDKCISSFALLPQSKFISKDELSALKQLAEDLDSLSNQDAADGAAACSEDDICPICYAHELSVVFKPCGHKSCKSCIAFQFMNKKECFFCKASIKKVEDFSGNAVKLN